ncbi:hypothetical protein WG66_002105 [Moniliophthora roreri]|nr:hypothetical protein WG66_002105 [Moniliophthora roreri]
MSVESADVVFVPLPPLTLPSPPTLSALTTSIPSRTSTASSATPIGYLLTMLTRYATHPQIGIYVEHPFLRDSHSFVTASNTSHPYDSSIYRSTRQWTTFVFLPSASVEVFEPHVSFPSATPVTCLSFVVHYHLTSNVLVPAY